MKNQITGMAKKHRTPKYNVDEILYTRWSPRAMSGEPMALEDLMPLFEAARWAPSSNNAQPWGFIVSLRSSKSWPDFLSLLFVGNQIWAKDASALVCVISRKDYEYNSKPNRSHSFDTGAAWQNLALQGVAKGFVVHAMGGFEVEKASKLLGIPDGYNIECMVAIGKPADKKVLPENLQQREIPSQRKPASEIVMVDRFKE